jgi:hypothetical protein
MVRPVRYDLADTWRVDAAPDDVFAVLADLAAYPRWWPEVRTAERLDERSVRLTCRSALPYDLRFVAVERRRDARAGIIEGELRGDLDGWSRWTIRPAAPGTWADFREVVVTTRRFMNVLAPVARPLFLRNHARMMRNGEEGLRAHLRGGRPAGRQP